MILAQRPPKDCCWLLFLLCRSEVVFCFGVENSASIEQPQFNQQKVYLWNIYLSKQMQVRSKINFKNAEPPIRREPVKFYYRYMGGSGILVGEGKSRVRYSREKQQSPHRYHVTNWEKQISSGPLGSGARDSERMPAKPRSDKLVTSL